MLAGFFILGWNLARLTYKTLSFSKSIEMHYKIIGHYFLHHCSTYPLCKYSYFRFYVKVTFSVG
ncbi:IS1 family transposase [Xenorhabdus sp. Sc-CR9]|uniref:IS1 family transposase n=1 Tax=Xenorhabdus sp. Sc-CR9 TaxID=2584468 RepID=UPI003FCE1586